MGMGNANGLMEVTMLDKSKMVSKMGKVYINGQEDKITKDNGKIANNMVKEYLQTVKVNHEKVYGIMDTE